MTVEPNDLDKHWYDFIMIIPSWIKGCLIAILGVGLVAGLFYWYGIRSPEEFAEEKVFVAPEETEVAKEVQPEVISLPEPGEGYSYFPFDLGMGVFNLILPDGTNVLDIAGAKHFATADLGGDIFLTLQIVEVPLPAGDDCSGYTEERLEGFEHTGGFFKMTHLSGVEACVFNGTAFDSHVFEFNLIFEGYGYEFQTMSPLGNEGPYIPTGTLDLLDPGIGSATLFIFSDGFESGDTSVWSN